MNSASRATLSPFALFLVLVISLGWGVNWPVMKWIVQGIPVLHFRLICVGGGALGLFVVARAMGLPIAVPKGRWPALIAIGLCNVTAWNFLTGYAILLLPAGRASILGFTMPLFSVPLSVWLLGERLSARRVFGLAAGLAGLALLLWDELTRLNGAPLGVALMLGAAFFWAVGTLLIKRYPIGLPASSLSAWQLALTALPIGIAARVFEPQGMPEVSLAQAAGLAYVVLIAFVLCYWAWYRLVDMVTVTVSSISSMLVPVVGVVSGMLMLGEELRWQEIAALLLVLTALASVSLPSAPRARLSGA